MFRPDCVTKGFQKILKKSGFSHIRFHDLRHSCARALYDKGWGLKDIQTTGDIYTHISNSRKKILAKDLAGIFSIE